ncbi:hypothetical protein ACHHYP_06147 [Achlya hypogyna]|uniref:Uncharacterized protein n=1 Tax=Achlya hypogyna TaxID=1202772 RepID=A0A1V9ZN88_ACHHY|nr:hypothetical protein ACHHYP_06147 [Achlya hypogyna]
MAEVDRGIPVASGVVGPGAYSVKHVDAHVPSVRMHPTPEVPPERDTRSCLGGRGFHWSHTPRFPRSFSPRKRNANACDRVAAVHSPQSREHRARQHRLWSMTIVAIEAHRRLFRVACVYRTCLRLTTIYASQRAAKQRAFVRWHRSTVEHMRYVLQHIVRRLVWPHLLQARGALRLRAASVLRGYLAWTAAGPVFVKAVQRYLGFVRRIQSWWRTLYGTFRTQMDVLALQWHAHEEALRRTYLADRKQIFFAPLAILWHLRPVEVVRYHAHFPYNTQWGPLTFTLTPDGKLRGRDADDRLTVSCTPTAVELYPTAGAAPLVVVYPVGDMSRCLVLSSGDTSELLVWLNKLLLSIELRLALAMEIDPSSLQCQLRLKALRDKRQLRTCEVEGSLNHWIFPAVHQSTFNKLCFVCTGDGD